MTARCTTCSNYYRFRSSRGAKLSERRCECGGKYEIMSMNVSPVKLPLNEIPDGVDTGPDGYVYPRKNRAGQLFLYHRATGKYIEFKQPLTTNE